MLSPLFKLISIFAFILPLTHCSNNTATSLNAEASITTINNEKPTREQLLNIIYEQRMITLVYPADIPTYQPLVEKIARNARWIKINLSSTKEVDIQQLKQGAFYLLGTPESNPFIQQFLSEFPLTLTSESTILGAQNYVGKQIATQISIYPNPLNKQSPISVLTADTDDTIIQLIEEKQTNGRWRTVGEMGYEVYQNNRRIVMGNFDSADWAIESPKFDFSQTGKNVLATKHYNFICENCEVDSLELQRFAQQLEIRYSEILQSIQPKSNKVLEDKIDYYLYPTAETKGLLTGSTERSHLNFSRKEIHTVLNDIYREHELGEEHIYFLRKWIGEPKYKFLERGIALHFTKKWQQKGYQHWAVQLFNSNNLPLLSTLLDNQKFAEGSDLVLHSSAATLVDYLMSKWGERAFWEKYSDWQPTPAELVTIKKEWHYYLTELAVNYQNNEKRLPTMPFCKGFNFAHEGYQIFNGYGSQLAAQSLEKLQGMGVNSIAIVPYSYQRNPKQPAQIPLVQQAGNENDEAVIHSTYTARQLGQTTMLKPQIWLGRGEWPGSIQMANKAQWQEWMQYYHDWIIHFALLAEIHEMELFCLGVEFVKATTQNPDEWRQLIQQIRGVYNGYLTYAANWGEEFQNINFWDDLDYIGLNSYYPLSASNHPTKKELMAGFAAVEKTILQVTEKYNKPLLFTEIGFRSIDTPWQNPHAAADGANFNEMHQKLAYEVIYESTQHKDWCNGIYWWKFPTYLHYQGDKNTSFTPNNKAAEEVVRAYWKE